MAGAPHSLQVVSATSLNQLSSSSILMASQKTKKRRLAERQLIKVRLLAFVIM